MNRLSTPRKAVGRLGPGLGFLTSQCQCLRSSFSSSFYCSSSARASSYISMLLPQVTAYLWESPSCTAGWWEAGWGQVWAVGKLSSRPGGCWPLPPGVLRHYCLHCNSDNRTPGTEMSINIQRRADDLQRNRWKHTSLKHHRRINESTQT